jgi:hypothetical protein
MIHVVHIDASVELVEEDTHVIFFFPNFFGWITNELGVIGPSLNDAKSDTR